MNKVILIGNLTKDPDVRTTNSGTYVTTFDIAVQRQFKGADGQKQTDFIPIVVWRQLAVREVSCKGAQGWNHR